MKRSPRFAVVVLTLLAACWGASPLLAQAAGPTVAAPATKPIVLPAAGGQGSAPAGPAATPQTVVVNTGPSMDELKQEAPSLFQQVLGGLLGGVDQSLADVLDAAKGLNFITQTPPGLSYRHPDVRRLWGATRAIADAALALILLVGGYNVLLRRWLGERYDGPMELLSRVVVGALLANMSMWWASAAIDIENDLCAAVGAQLPDAKRFLPYLLLAVPWSPVRLLAAAAVLLFLIACLVLAFQMVMRLVLIDVLLVLAPLGLLCWVLPQTQRWARLWSETFVGAVLVQFIQVIGMLLAANMVAPFGSGAGAAATALGPLLGLASVWLVLKLPGLVGRHAGDGTGLVRGVVLGTVARTAAPVAAGALRGATRGGGQP